MVDRYEVMQIYSSKDEEYNRRAMEFLRSYGDSTYGVLNIAKFEDYAERLYVKKVGEVEQSLRDEKESGLCFASFQPVGTEEEAQKKLAETKFIHRCLDDLGDLCRGDLEDYLGDLDDDTD